MRRREALALAAAGLGLCAASVTWLFGALGLAGAGVVLLVLALLVDVTDGG